MMEKLVREYLEEAKDALQALIGNAEAQKAVAQAAELLATTFRNGGRVFSCGNGGSMCDAMHFAEELSGRYRDDRPGLPATAISDPSYLTCAGNDYGYEFVFSRYLEAHARKGDVLLAISTSGKSRNIMTAVETAKKNEVKVIGLMGQPDTPLGHAADIRIAAPAGKYADHVQELHIKIIHILIGLVERQMFEVTK